MSRPILSPSSLTSSAGQRHRRSAHRSRLRPDPRHGRLYEHRPTAPGVWTALTLTLLVLTLCVAAQRGDRAVAAHGGPVVGEGRALLADLVECGGRTAFQM